MLKPVPTIVSAERRMVPGLYARWTSGGVRRPETAPFVLGLVLEASRSMTKRWRPRSRKTIRATELQDPGRNRGCGQGL
jgi:hypothetical protein